MNEYDAEEGQALICLMVNHENEEVTLKYLNLCPKEVLVDASNWKALISENIQLKETSSKYEENSNGLLKIIKTHENRQTNFENTIKP